MDNRQKEIDNLKDYKYGFTTDIESTTAPKGLNEDVIRFISNVKKEPQWMLDFRLKAFERFKQLKEPDWQKPKYPKIDYQDLYYYSAPKSMKDKPKNLNELDPKLLETYKKLGIPLQEQKGQWFSSRWDGGTHIPVGLLVSLIIFFELIIVIGGWKYKPDLLNSLSINISTEVTNTRSIGNVLYTDYILLFQISGMILLVAMIGAIVLTYRERAGVKRQSYVKQISRERDEGVDLVDVEKNKGVKIDA